MTRRWFAALLLCGSSIAHADGGWSALWHTPDQRGEAALRAGDAAAAAAAYSDLRRKAYAQLKAGDYRGAAQSYAGFDDAEAHYNRGNALARAGDLQQALRAYDAALAKNPGDADAQRNRDLVARALQPPPPGSAPGRQPLAQAGGQAPPPPGPAASGRPGDPAPGRGTAASPGPAPSPAGADSAGASGDPAAPSGSRTAATGSAGARDAAGAAAPDPANTDDAAQAQRDVIGGAPRAAGRRDPQDAKREPPTEQQLSEEQWLRRLPDDPGGLLRRKFLIQQLIRQGTPP